MTQVTGAKTMRNCRLEYSTNASDWNDFSGAANSIEPSGYARKSGEVYTGDSDDPIIGLGKNDPLELDINVVYTESSVEAYMRLHGYKTAGTALKVRWSPAGGATGDYRYTTSTGYVVECLPPGGELESGDPILGAVKVKAPGYSAAAIS